MVALPPKSNGDGDMRGRDSAQPANTAADQDAIDIAEIEKFESNLRKQLPRMERDALKRVEEQLHTELDQANERWLWKWRNRSASVGGAGHAGSKLLNVIAAAAVVMLVAGVCVVVFLAMNKETVPKPIVKIPPPPVQVVVDEIDVIVEHQVDPSAPPLFERPMINVSPYQSLIGDQNVTQR